MPYSLTVNGTTLTIDASEDTPLLYVLRDELGLNGAKYGCGVGQCGACTVLSNDVPVRSCFVPAASLTGRKITTLEGLRAPDGALHALQRAFLAEQAGQCGYCIPGMIMTAAALLREKPAPTEADIRAALNANLCRCGSHNRIVRAIQRAVKDAGAADRASGAGAADRASGAGAAKEPAR
jgi:nicotinate dehydrogenase subunit A